MGKSSGWFRRLFAGKKQKNSPVSESSGSVSKQAKNKKKSSVFGSGSAEETYAAPFKEVETRASCAEPPSDFSQMDASRRAITVAAAAAAVAEAAVAAAQAAAEVVRLTNNGRCSGSAGRRLDVAAVIIQSAFRGYLARRALKALKALVKLQALVRGHIVRKQTADMLRRMQALARVQARARASRTRAAFDSSSHSDRRLSLPHHTRWGSNPNIKSELDASWLEQWMEECSWNKDRKKRSDYYSSRRDEEILDKTEVVDSWKPKTSSNTMGGKRKPAPQKQISCQSMGRVPSSLSLPQLPSEADETSAVCSAHNSPQGSIGSCRGRSTTTTTTAAAGWSPRSTDCATNMFSDHPKYMAKTESSRAKVRSQSAPRLRLDFQKPRSTFHGCWDPSSSPTKSIVKTGRTGSGLLNRVGSSTRIR